MQMKKRCRQQLFKSVEHTYADEKKVQYRLSAPQILAIHPTAGACSYRPNTHLERSLTGTGGHKRLHKPIMTCSHTPYFPL